MMMENQFQSQNMYEKNSIEREEKRRMLQQPKKKMKNNRLIFPLICAVIIALMYMIAFHETRDELKALKTIHSKCGK
jgi:predicted nucleic acid-binding Zn ribbon protein